MLKVLALVSADCEAIAVRPASDTWQIDPRQTSPSFEADHVRDKIGAPRP